MKFINGILRFLAFLLLSAVVIALPLSLLARDVGQLLFDGDTIKALVGDNLLSPEFVGQLAQRATQGVLNRAENSEEGVSASDEGGAEAEGLDIALLGEGLSYLEEEDWVQIAALVAPADAVSETVTELVDAYIAWLDSDGDFPQIKLDLSEWKSNTQLHAREVVEIVLAALPECTADEILNQALEGLQAGEGLAEVAIPICRPGEPAYSTLLRNADSMVSGLTQRAPDQLDTQVLPSETAPEELVRLKENLVRARLYLRWSWVAALGVMAIGVLLAARTWLTALVWAGWTLLLAGGITMILGSGVQLLASGGLERLVVAMFADAPVTLSAIGTTVAAGVFPLVARPLLIQGGVLLALGFGSLIWARIRRDRANTLIPSE